MIHEVSRSHSSALTPDDDMEFEPTLSAEMVQGLRTYEEHTDEGELVRDEELIASESEPYTQFPDQPPLQKPASTAHFPVTGEGQVGPSFQSVRRSVPPPLVPPLPSRRIESSVEPSRKGSLPPMSGPHTLERRRGSREIIREGDLLLGKLRIERVMTEGLIVIADAVHLHLGTRAQVVLLSPMGRGFSESQEHFMRTARSVAQMQSEHVAKVTEVGVLESGAPFLVAEMTGNSDLAEVIRVRGAFAVTDAVDYTIQIAEALAEAHSLGILHGNLRPSCLRVAEGIDGWPLIKVLGFGTMAQWFLNTTSIRSLGNRTAASALSYLSPEQIRTPSDVDARTDIWSLGALLHEMLVTWPLYQAETPAALLAMIAADPPPAVSALRADVPRSLESVILRCLQKDRNLRFTSISDLARALQPFASATTHAAIERIVRVLARNSAATSPYVRPNSALVHVRGQSAGPKSFEPRSQQKPTAMAHMGLIAGGVAALGVLAGVTGAFFTTQALKSSTPTGSVVDGSASLSNDRGSTLKSEVLTALPAATPGSAAVASEAPVAAATVAAAPAAVRVAMQSAPRVIPRAAPIVSVPKHAATQSTTVALPKEARAEKTDYGSVKKATDLFSDMK